MKDVGVEKATPWEVTAPTALSATIMDNMARARRVRRKRTIAFVALVTAHSRFADLQTGDRRRWTWFEVDPGLIRWPTDTEFYRW